MRADVGPVAADLLFLLTGYGVLNAMGFLRTTAVDWLGALGLSFLAGVIWVSLFAVALLTVGIPLTLTTFVVLSTGTAVAGLSLRRDWLSMVRPCPNTGGLRQRARSLPWYAWAGGATLAGFFAYALSGGFMAAVRPLQDWDAWSIWSRKAEMLFHTGRLTTDFFASSAYTFMHPDYPLLVPVFESIEYRAMGAVDTRAIHLQFWLLLMAFVLAILYLGLRRGTLLEWLPLAVVVAITPSVVSQIFTAYADIPLALFLAVGVLLLGEWLVRHDPKNLAVSVLFLAGTASTKNEGLVAAVIVLFVAAIVTLVGVGRREKRQFVIAGAAFAAAILPWRIWLSVEGIHGDISPRKGVDPSYLSHRTSRVWPSVEYLYGQLEKGGWLYAVPIAASIALVCLLIRGRRALAAFYLSSGVLVFGALVWVYWISPTAPIGAFLASSAYRVVAILAALSFAAILQLPLPARDGRAE
jgi:hypothetical protein